MTTENPYDESTQNIGYRALWQAGYDACASDSSITVLPHVPAEIAGVMSPVAWLSIISGDDDGALPPCCSLISELREHITVMLGVFQYNTAISVVRGIDSHDWIPDAELLRLRSALAKWLDENYVDWETYEPPTDDDMEGFEARLLFNDGAPVDAPELAWDDCQVILRSVTATMSTARPDNSDGNVVNAVELMRNTLRDALLRGVPAPIVMDLYEAWRSILRAQIQGG